MRKYLILAGFLAALPLMAATATPIQNPHVNFFDSAGAPCAGCSLYSYAAGTTTPQATYTDSTEGAQNQNPTILDASGGAQIWMGSNAYKFVLKDTLGTTIWTVDEVGLNSLYCAVAGCTLTGMLNGVGITMLTSTTPANGISPYNFTFNNLDATSQHYRGLAATCNVLNGGGACYGALIQENDQSNDSAYVHNVGLNVGVVNPNTSSSSHGSDIYGIAITTNLGPLGTDTYWSGSGLRLEGTIPVQYGFNTTDGSAYIGLNLGALTATGTSQSQYLLMHGISAGSDSSNFALWADSAGNGFIEPSGFSTSLTLQGTSVPSGVVNSYLLLQPNGQYVGVGTVSPFYQFDVLGTAAARTLVAYDSAAPTVSWVAGAAGSTKWSLYSGVTDPAALILKDTASAAIAQFSPSASGGVYQVGGTGATYSGYGSVYEAPNTNAPYLGLEAWGGGGGTDFRQFRLSSNSTPTLNFQYGIGTANAQTFSSIGTFDQYGNFAIKGHYNQLASGDSAGICTMVSSTSCTFLISAAFNSPPICIASAEGSTPGVAACGVSGTTVTITASVSNSLTWGALLIGNPN